MYFGKGALANALKAELPAVAKKVLQAYGGGSIKKNGIYQDVRRGRKSPRKTLWTTFWLWAAGSVIDCCKIVAAQGQDG